MPIGPAPDWTDITWMIGNYEGTPTLIAVDEDGKMIAVFQGLGPDGLITLKTDDEGRLIAILTDPGDVWQVFKQMGLAEHAVRVGGIGGYDRRGDAIFIETFEDGRARWGINDADTGSEAELTTVNPLQGGLCMKMTAGSGGTRRIGIWHNPPYPILGKVALEGSFTLEADVEFIEWWILLYDGTTRHIAMVRYDNVNNKVQYMNSGGVYTDLITGVDLYNALYSYHTLKVVIDVVNDLYVRVLIDSWSWTDGDLALQTVADSDPKRYYVALDAYAVSGQDAVSYFDRIIVTQNEPAN